MNSTQIPITKTTRERLRLMSYKSQTYDQLINRLINFEKKFLNEEEFHRWVEENYFYFGFDSVIRSSKTRYPDMVVMKNGKQLRVEIETYSSNFLRHQHDPSKTDMVICLVNDVELPVKTIEIEKFTSPAVATISFIGDVELRRQIRIAAAKQDKSMSAFIYELLKQYFIEYKPEGI